MTKVRSSLGEVVDFELLQIKSDFAPKSTINNGPKIPVTDVIDGEVVNVSTRGILSAPIQQKDTPHSKVEVVESVPLASIEPKPLVLIDPVNEEVQEQPKDIKTEKKRG